MEQFRAQNTYQIPVDVTIYTIQAVLRAAYWLTDRCFIHVTRTADGHYCVNLSPRPESDEPLDLIAGEFVTSLIDQQLRVELAESSRTVRDLIVAKAFAEGNLLDDPVPGDPRDPVARGQEWNDLVASS